MLHVRNIESNSFLIKEIQKLESKLNKEKIEDVGTPCHWCQSTLGTSNVSEQDDGYQHCINCGGN